MKTIVRSLLAFPIVLAACGDNKPATTPDAGESSDARPPAAPIAIVVSGDFVPGDPGIMASIDPVTQKVTKAIAPQGAVGDDPVLRHIGNELLIVNRNDGNNVTILDDRTFALIGQFATGVGSNPQDVAVVGNKLYVPTFAGKGVVVIDRTSMMTTEIDLGADDPDGHPDCASIYLSGGKLYVACGLLDNFAPRGLGKVYVVDPATNAKTATITLTSKNPFGMLELSSATAGGLVIPTVEFPSLAGCIELVPTDGGTSSTCLVSNAALGTAYALRTSFHGTGEAAVMYVVASKLPAGYVVTYDFASHAVIAQHLSSASQVAGDVVACPDGTIVYTDQTKDKAGVRVRSALAELTTAALDVGLAPSSSHGLVCY